MFAASIKLKRGFLRVLCALFLFAQNVALVHAAWHASHDHGAHEEYLHDDDHSGDAPQSAGFCSFDAVLGQVLSGAPATDATFNLAAATASAAVHCSRTLTAADLLTPRSRGPPPLL
jgi:hypothetical protein